MFQHLDVATLLQSFDTMLALATKQADMLEHLVSHDHDDLTPEQVTSMQAVIRQHRHAFAECRQDIERATPRWRRISAAILD